MSSRHRRKQVTDHNSHAVRLWLDSGPSQGHRLAANAFWQARTGREYDPWDWGPLTLTDIEFVDRLLRDLGIAVPAGGAR